MINQSDQSIDSINKSNQSINQLINRWGVYTQETPLFRPNALGVKEELLVRGQEVGEAEEKDKEMITAYEDSVAAHLTKILNSDDNVNVISSAK